MNRVIKKKLIKTKQPLRSIEQQYKRATNLDRYKRESKQKEKKLRERKEIEAQAPRLNILANISRA